MFWAKKNIGAWCFDLRPARHGERIVLVRVPMLLRFKKRISEHGVNG